MVYECSLFLKLFPCQFDQALAMLPDAESRAAVMRYKFDNDRQLALASQLLRRYVFAKYYGFEWDTIRFGSMTKGGKPVLLVNVVFHWCTNHDHEPPFLTASTRVIIIITISRHVL